MTKEDTSTVVTSRRTEAPINWTGFFDQRSRKAIGPGLVRTPNFLISDRGRLGHGLVRTPNNRTTHALLLPASPRGPNGSDSPANTRHTAATTSRHLPSPPHPPPAPPSTPRKTASAPPTPGTSPAETQPRQTTPPSSIQRNNSPGHTQSAHDRCTRNRADDTTRNPHQKP